MESYDYSLHYAEFHDDSAEHAEKMARWLAALLRPHLPVDLNAPILDVGCGYGFALRALRNLGYTHLMGLEVSREQARRAEDAGFAVAVVNDSTPWLRGQPGRFAAIVLLDVLEHTPQGQQIEFARALHTALSPGGRLILTVPNANSLLAARWRYIDYTHFSSFTEHSLRFVLRNAGFDRIEIPPSKPLPRMPLRLWRREAREALRYWLIRWCWLQVFRVELPEVDIRKLNVELNLTAVATKRPMSAVAE